MIWKFNKEAEFNFLKTYKNRKIHMRKNVLGFIYTYGYEVRQL